MNTIRKIKKYVNVAISFFIVMIFTVTLISCSDDDIDALPDNHILTINVETAQDQMGEFYGNAMALHNGKVWSSFGYMSPLNGVAHNGIWSSDNGISWSTVTTVGEDGLNGDARTEHTMTSFNGKLWIIGGESNAGTWFSDIWSSVNGNEWVIVTDVAPFGAIARHSTVVFNGKLFVIAVSTSTGYMEVWSTPDGENWTQETANAFPGRVTQKAVVFNNAIYVIGGEQTANDKLNEIWQSSDGITWTQVETNSPIFSERNQHTATVYNNKVWVIGGRTETGFGNDIWYSSNMMDWTKYNGPLVEDDLHHHTALLYNDAIWIFGGYNNSGITGQIVSIKED